MRASARCTSPPGPGVTTLENGVCRGELQLADRGLNFMRSAGFADLDQRRLEVARLLGRAVAQQPLPHRQQRGAADLARPCREHCRRPGTARADGTTAAPDRRCARRVVFVFVFGAAHDLAQLFEHEVGDGHVFAALDGALELPHQQRLRLRRKLCEIFPQPLDRCLAHAPGMHACVARTAKCASTRSS